jgi:hypothetical protein
MRIDSLRQCARYVVRFVTAPAEAPLTTPSRNELEDFSDLSLGPVEPCEGRARLLLGCCAASHVLLSASASCMSSSHALRTLDRWRTFHDSSSTLPGALSLTRWRIMLVLAF